ncbi:MAG: hypothetical protein Q7I92_11410, partial [Humidesulfovibrio sp.]|nr:hypothetical protein [Humidesulfovibrio sp.]
MRRALLRFALIVMMLLNSACAAGIYQAIAPEGDENNLKARFDENIALFEPRYEQNALVNTQLMYLCEAYSRTKRFTKLSACLDRMAEHYAAGETTYFNIDLIDYIALARTKAAIDLGDYAGAVTYSTGHLGRRKDEMSRTFAVQMVAYAGLAKALRADRQGAEASIVELESIYLGYPFNLVQPERNEGEARIFMALKQYDKAYEVMQRSSAFAEFAKSMTQAVMGSPGWFVIMELPTQYMKARAAYLSGRIEEAKKGYDALLANERTRDSGEILWQLLFDRGRIAEAEGKGEVALRFYMQSVEVVEQQRKSISTETSKIGFVGDKQALYQSLIALLIRQGQPAKAFEYVERAKSRALVDLLAERQNLLPQDQSNVTQALGQLASLEQRSAYIH